MICVTKLDCSFSRRLSSLRQVRRAFLCRLTSNAELTTPPRDYFADLSLLREDRSWCLCCRRSSLTDRQLFPCAFRLCFYSFSVNQVYIPRLSSAFRVGFHRDREISLRAVLANL